MVSTTFLAVCAVPSNSLLLVWGMLLGLAIWQQEVSKDSTTILRQTGLEVKQFKMFYNYLW